MYKLRLIFTLGICLVLGLYSCKKNKDKVINQAVAFSFSAPDTLVFEHSDAKQLSVSVQCSQNKEFGASLSSLNLAFTDGFQQLIIPSNQSASFDIHFYQNSANPGTYPCELTVSVLNENNTPQTKTIQLIYAPNCAFNYRNYLNGEITFQINGILLNKSINCLYNEQGQLVVNSLTSFPVVLNFDCAAQTVTMQALTNNGFYMTGDGYIQGQNINLNIYSDGVLDAVARIKI